MAAFPRPKVAEAGIAVAPAVAVLRPVLALNLCSSTLDSHTDPGQERTSVPNNVGLESIFCKALGMVHHPGTAAYVAQNENGNGT